jgi:hypothetical protein
VAVTGALPASAVADADGRLTLRVDLGPPHSQDQFSGSSQPSFVTRVVRFQPGGRTASHERPWIELPARRSCRRLPTSVTAKLVRRRASGEKLAAVGAYLHGRRVVTKSGSRVPARLTVRGLGRGRATVRVVGRTSAGRRIHAARRYPRCRLGD